jgi:hypothetical protein
MAPPAVVRTAPMEYELEPRLAAPAAPAARDVSDEFHDRFLEIANEDTSEDLLKSSMDAPLLTDADDLQFPVDLKEEAPGAAEKLSLEFEKTDLDSPARTMFAGPADRLSMDLTPNKIVDKERLTEKVRPETRSPQDELALLSGQTKRETKVAPPPAAVPPVVDAQRFELTGKLEDKLNQTIKELLWEIVPPLAEKIIKEEIDKIKSELSDSGL